MAIGFFTREMWFETVITNKHNPYLAEVIRIQLAKTAGGIEADRVEVRFQFQKHITINLRSITFEIPGEIGTAHTKPPQRPRNILFTSIPDLPDDVIEAIQANIERSGRWIEPPHQQKPRPGEMDLSKLPSPTEADDRNERVLRRAGGAKKMIGLDVDVGNQLCTKRKRVARK